MKTLNQYIQEKLIVNKDYRDGKMYHPKSFDELRKIIKYRYNTLGPGTKQNPIDFNDIDVSNIDSFLNKNNVGIFERTKFEYIDISEWDASNMKSTCSMFYLCEKLESVGDISKWDVSSVTDMSYMFAFCKKFNQDLSKWDVSSVTDMSYMFACCEYFNNNISNWNVSNVIYNKKIFEDCPIKNEYKPKFNN